MVKIISLAQTITLFPGVSLAHASTSPLKRTSPYFHEVLQGETVVLEAKAEPKMPFTFYSNRLGQFQNLLGTISVPADENGVARAEFTVSTGTRDEVEVFAASPVHSGQIRYLIKINQQPGFAVAAKSCVLPGETRQCL